MIRDEEIKIMAGKIADNFQPERIILFGSTASGRATGESDIDLCVIKNGIKDKPGEIVKIRKILGNSPWPIDMLIFNSEEFARRRDIFGTVQYEIDKNGRVLYERD